MVAKGVILRRTRVVGLAARLDADGRAVASLNRLRRRYRGAPLLLRLPGRRVVLLLSAPHVHRVLSGSPDPYSLDTAEKHASLQHFEPHGVLVSTGRTRERRRTLNERVLDTDRPVHRLLDSIRTVVDQEAATLLDRVGADGDRLDWPGFTAGFTRIIRRVVLGDGAADDQRTTELLNGLRAEANWSFLRPPRPGPRRELAGRIGGYVGRAEPGSLAALLKAEADRCAATGEGGEAAVAELDPAGQVPQWLFAFDAAGIATFRTMALLATHPRQAADAAAQSGDPHHAHLRACLLESVRLWPTTLVVLRESTGATRWGETALPAGTVFAAPCTFLHRDPGLPYADRFTPDIWLDGQAPGNWSLIPFSGGPGACPGRNLVLLVTSTLLAALLRDHRFRLTSRPDLRPDRPLPHTLNHAAIRLSIAR
jgi:cytochrome P450